MTRKLEASGHVRRTPAPSDKRASVVALTDSGTALAERVKRLWCDLAEETVTGLPADTVATLPGILRTLTSNVDTKRRREGYEPSALDWVRDHVDEIMHTGTTSGVTMKDRPMVPITYRGALTGKIRKTPVMRVEHEGQYAAVASKGGEPTNPHWYTAYWPSRSSNSRTARRSASTTPARSPARRRQRGSSEQSTRSPTTRTTNAKKTNREIPLLVLEPTGRLGGAL